MKGYPWLHVERWPKGMRRYFRISCGKEPLGYSCTAWIWLCKLSWIWTDVPILGALIKLIGKAIHIAWYCWRDARGLPPMPTVREVMGGREPHRCLLCGRPVIPLAWMPEGHPDRWGHRVFYQLIGRPGEICTHHASAFGTTFIDCDTNVSYEADDLSAKSLYCLDVLGDELTYWIAAVCRTLYLIARRARWIFAKKLPVAW